MVTILKIYTELLLLNGLLSDSKLEWYLGERYRAILALLSYLFFILIDRRGNRAGLLI